MDFELSEEQQTFADAVRRFARDKLADGALERAHSAHFPWDAAKLVALTTAGELRTYGSQRFDGADGTWLTESVLHLPVCFRDELDQFLGSLFKKVSRFARGPAGRTRLSGWPPAARSAGKGAARRAAGDAAGGVDRRRDAEPGGAQVSPGFLVLFPAAQLQHSSRR